MLGVIGLNDRGYRGRYMPGVIGLNDTCYMC
jgi:hypothetical protein